MLAFLMGTMFPLGFEGSRETTVRISRGPGGANGFASVVGAPLAALIAVEAGSRVLLLVATAAYTTAALLTRR